MSINHLIDPATNPRYDIYVNDIDAQEGKITADTIFSIENMKAQGRMTAGNFKLGSTQEVAIADNDTDKYKFDTNLTIEPASATWVSIAGGTVQGCKMTRDKLHYNFDSDSFRKVFNFDLNFTLNVDYSLRAGATLAQMLFKCNGFFDFVPVTPGGARINKIVFNQGQFYTYDVIAPTGVFGQVRCFANATPDEEGFIIDLLPVNAMPTSGTEQWTCQIRCSIIDSEELPAVVPPED